SARGTSTSTWSVSAQSGALRVTGPEIGSMAPHGAFVVRPADSTTFLLYNGHRYRGDLICIGTDTGVTVVNRLPVETYLRGVVPMEIGLTRTSAEVAAVAAQAVAARSFVYTRLNDTHPYDVTATVLDQVYGGADAERPVADSAIDMTWHMVLWYGGKIVSAP